MATIKDDNYFHHALKVMDDVCVGCTHCMAICPTQAIKIISGKAVISDNRCVDCGECARICPVDAIIVEQDDFNLIHNYKARVALIPGVFIGQFPERVETGDIYSAIKNLGFTHIYEVENTVGFILEGFEDYENQNEEGLKISPFCPAIIRLIQVSFPTLAKNIAKIKPPIDIAAQYYRHKLLKEGFKEEEIGIFYITPCAAKIASVKSPVGVKDSKIDGVINMQYLYNQVNIELRKPGLQKEYQLNQDMLSKEGVLWSLTGGEKPHHSGKSIAIDEIHNVKEFLEQLENEVFEKINFLELRACDQSCAGGLLLSGNRFLTADRLRNRAEKYPPLKDKRLYKKNTEDDIHLGDIEPRPMERLDIDINKSFKKMAHKQRLMCYLPGIDCGVCGFPDCQSLANEIVQGKAGISYCIFMQKKLVQRGLLSKESADAINARIWGENRFQKNCEKNGATNELS
ncbi:MAG: 4Fe-4S dicluster domain-containing protein [Bacteroidales bacterium]|nr:4Fe-4S dicluster domain-containing protein [Bacteroidales bacterium]MCF8390501.1 4Fe-4S dicluster domain-containing protein [Bacteroidales bacterium]